MLLKDFSLSNGITVAEERNSVGIDSVKYNFESEKQIIHISSKTNDNVYITVNGVEYEQNGYGTLIVDLTEQNLGVEEITLKSNAKSTNFTLKAFGDLYNTSIREEDRETLKKLVYVEKKDKLVAEVAIETELNSFFLGGQHKISSGGDNVFFTNKTRKESSYSVKGSLKDQFNVDNIGADGVVLPFKRIYTDLLTEDEDNQELNPLNYIEYIFENFEILENRTSFGIEFRTGQLLDIGNKIKFTISRDETEIYQQSLIVEEIKNIGDLVKFQYEQPIDYDKGDLLDIKLEITDDDRNWSYLLTSESVIAGVAYDKVFRRRFIDVPIYKNHRVIDLNSTDLEILPEEKIVVGTLENDINMTLNSITESFSIQDPEGNLGINSIIVNLDGDSFEVDKRGDFVMFCKINNTWTYFNFRTGSGSTIGSSPLVSELEIVIEALRLAHNDLSLQVNGGA